MEYNHFDLYFTTTSNESKYIEKLKKKLNFTHPELGITPYYKNFIIKRSKNKSNQAKTVLFLPIVRKKGIQRLISKNILQLWTQLDGTILY